MSRPNGHRILSFHDEIQEKHFADLVQHPALCPALHSHQDHYGLLEDVPCGWPVHCGEATGRLMRLSSSFCGKEVPNTFIPWKSGIPLEIGPFVVTPLLTDHSAFDPHMMFIEVNGGRILYSGDFRMHGRKSALRRD